MADVRQMSRRYMRASGIDVGFDAPVFAHCRLTLAGLHPAILRANTIFCKRYDGIMMVLQAGYDGAMRAL